MWCFLTILFPSVLCYNKRKLVAMLVGKKTICGLRGLSVARPVLFLGASKKWTGSVPRPLLLYNSGVDICAVNVPSRYGPFLDAAFVHSAFVDDTFVNNAIVNGASVHATFVDGAFTQAALVDAVIVDGASAPSSTTPRRCCAGWRDQSGGCFPRCRRRNPAGTAPRRRAEINHLGRRARQTHPVG